MLAVNIEFGKKNTTDWWLVGGEFVCYAAGGEDGWEVGAGVGGGGAVAGLCVPGGDFEFAEGGRVAFYLAESHDADSGAGGGDEAADEGFAERAAESVCADGHGDVELPFVEDGAGDGAGLTFSFVDLDDVDGDRGIAEHVV